MSSSVLDVSTCNSSCENHGNPECRLVLSSGGRTEVEKLLEKMLNCNASNQRFPASRTGFTVLWAAAHQI